MGREVDNLWAKNGAKIFYMILSFSVGNFFTFTVDKEHVEDW
jgi:hypothetical protein